MLRKCPLSVYYYIRHWKEKKMGKDKIFDSKEVDLVKYNIILRLFSIL